MGEGAPASADALHALDFSSIDSLDPSLEGNFKILYDREVPLELRVQQSQDSLQQVGTLENIRCKVLVQEEGNKIHTVKLEISSEADLFFFFTHVLHQKNFQDIQQQQKLMVEFDEYPNVLIHMLNECIKKPQSNLAVFIMGLSNQARLDFIQNMEYKFVELMSCQFLKAPENVTQQHITYRYNAMKTRLALMQSRLQEVTNLLKVKNPSLLLQLQKTVHAQHAHPNLMLKSTK